MNRDQIYALMDDYVDQCLDPTTEMEVRKGLDLYPDLREVAERQRAILSDLRELPESIEPPARVWTDIATRLNGQNSSRWFSPSRGLALAASLLVVFLGVGFIAGRWSMPPQVVPPSIGPSSASFSPANSSVATQNLVVSEAERALLQAKAELYRAVDLKRSSLPPDTVRLVDANLSIIGKAISEIRAAIIENPSNTELHLMLVSYHEHEVELLRQLTRATERI